MRTRKTIQGILKRKIADWLSTIEDEKLRELIGDNVLVTGGAIVSLLQGTKVNDYDVYLKNKDAVVKLAAHYLARFAKNPPPSFVRGGKVAIFLDDGTDPIDGREPTDRVRIIVKSAGIAAEDGDKGKYQYFEGASDESTAEYVEQVTQALGDDMTPGYVHDMQDMGEEEAGPELRAIMKEVDDVSTPPKEEGPGSVEKNRYRPVFISGNAITLSDGVQLCIRFHGDIEDIHRNFDYVHCTNYYDYAADNLVLNADALVSILTKELRYVGSLYPLCSVIRTRKFIKRGWSCNAGQYVKMAYQISQLDLDNVSVWEDQLIGVDTAYFQDLIGRLRKAEAEGAQVDGNYVIELIERMF